MVLGAGRGPLVRAAINAATITRRRIRIYIIEKNPNAIRTLKAIARKLWHNRGRSGFFNYIYACNRKFA